MTLNEYEVNLLDCASRLQAKSDEASVLHAQLASKAEELVSLQGANAGLSQQVEMLREQESSLLDNCETLLRDLENLKNLRTESEEAPLGGIDEQQELARIDANSRDAAFAYLRQVKLLQNEIKILQSKQDKLQYKYDELKEGNDELKVEARESAEELLRMEAQLEEL